jgi:hypothetical protein
MTVLLLAIEWRVGLVRIRTKLVPAVHFRHVLKFLP